MDDLDIELIRKRCDAVRGWRADVRDSRETDAPYLTVVARTQAPDPESVQQLWDAFTGLPRMDAYVWWKPRDEMLLEAMNPLDLLEERRDS